MIKKPGNTHEAIGGGYFWGAWLEAGNKALLVLF